MTEVPAHICRLLVERYRPMIPDPVQRLEFVSLCGRDLGSEGAWRRRRGSLWRWRMRAAVLESLHRASSQATRRLGWLDTGVLWTWLHRSALRSAAGCLVAVVLLAPLHPAPPRRAEAGPPPQEAAVRPAVMVPMALPRQVWLVESAGGSDLYSNGLRIENQHQTSTGPRAYPVTFLSDSDRVEWRRQPAGIVYHTTESEIAPLEPGQSEILRRRGRGLLEYVRRRQLYNFVIDRFGRAHRVAPEEQYAHHAGSSVWGYGDELYLGLNQSFLGVAFEASTSAATGVTPAQIHTGRLLTEMLRSRFGIEAENCVSHDLVSVNPVRMLIGHHTDWAGGFPYEAMGLPDQYGRETPSVALFGFRYDAAFVAAAGAPWPGIRRGEARLEREARERGIPVDRYRRALQEDYRRRWAPWRARLRAASGAGEGR